MYIKKSNYKFYSKYTAKEKKSFCYRLIKK